MIKKSISFTIVLFLMFLCYQAVITFFKNNHTIEYEVNGFMIEEEYKKNSSGDYYVFKVSDGENDFVFDTHNDFNKQKEVVKDVSIYSDENLYCVSLLYKYDNTSSGPLCVNEGGLYVMNSEKETDGFKEYVNKLPNVNKTEYSEESEIKKQKDISVNKDYLSKNEVLIIYDYQSVYFFEKDDLHAASYTNAYETPNNLGRIVGKYYLIPRLISTPTFNTFVKYNIETGVKTEINMIYKISKKSYINGVYNNKLYIFDTEELKQYEIDPYTDEVKITGDKQNDAFAYINGEETKVSVDEMNNNKIIFSEKTSDFEKVDYDSLFPQNKYAIYVKDGVFYKAYYKYPEIKIKLFEEKGAQKIKVYDDNIYYMKGNSIYRYNENGIVLLGKKDKLIKEVDDPYDIYLK